MQQRMSSGRGTRPSSFFRSGVGFDRLLIRRAALAGLAACWIGALAAAHCPALPDCPVPHWDRRPIDLVICLDTSGSMTGLIDSARGRLWEVVNTLSKARPVPHLRVGLLTYGSPKLSTTSAGWIVRQIDLTDDLDAVYEKMMRMVTDGGDEFVGWVLNDAVESMSWSRDPRALRLIFVAGNESADQAIERHNFRSVAETARGRGIIINAIYCGRREQGVIERWQEVAQCGGGKFTAIDMQAGTIQIPTPQDPILEELNRKLNDTYVPYGARGDARKELQIAQDRYAARMGVATAAERAIAKGQALYWNAGWDLVDASGQPGFQWEDVGEKDLPENMRPMSLEQRRAYIEGLRTARSAIQKEIAEANTARERFLDKSRAEKQGGVSLDDAMREAIREQATAKGFTFE